MVFPLTLLQLAPAYDLMNACLHIEGDDLGLNGGLSLTLEKSDVYERTGHPCRLDFERFGEHIGLKKKRIEMILASFSLLPDEVDYLVNNRLLILSYSADFSVFFEKD